MTRPPYLRWAAAALILIAGLSIELRPSPSVDVPVAIDDVAAGSILQPTDVVWRQAPVGLFEPVDLPATATRRISAGSVVTIADLRAGEDSIPPDWWSIELPVPPGASAGDPILAVVAGGDQTLAIRGMMSSDPVDDGFSDRNALVAFSSDDAVTVAAAASENRVTVLVGR